MHQRGLGRQLLAAVIILCALAQLSPASAYHEGDERITTDTAYTLGSGDVRLSLWTVDVGILDQLQVSSIYLANLLQVFNAGVKWRVWQGESLALSARLDVAYVDFENWPIKSESPATAVVVPFELTGSWQLGDAWSLHLSTLFTSVEASATPDADALQGAAGVDNAQGVLSAHWRWGRVTTLYVRGRQLLFQEAGGAVDFRVDLDDKTTAHVVAEGDTDAVDFGGVRSIVFGAIWSGELFNLRAGLGYGSWSLPVINFVIKEPRAIVDLDLYLKF